MDPYLEDPTLWPGLHDKIIYNLVEELNGIMPDNYVADTDHRLYVTHRNTQITPDVVTLMEPVRERPPARSGGTAVLTRADTPAILIAAPEEVSESYIEILHLTTPRRVVTVIDVLSHSNKSAGSEGRKSYLQKEQDVMKSPIHLLEIDLLRKGEHTVAPPYERIAFEFGRWDYLVSLSRSTDRTRYELHLRTVRQMLPCFRVPLANGDPDVEVDLQAIFDRCYKAGAYPRLVDYRRAPQFPPGRAGRAVGRRAACGSRSARRPGLGPTFFPSMPLSISGSPNDYSVQKSEIPRDFNASRQTEFLSGAEDTVRLPQWVQSTYSRGRRIPKIQ